MMHRIGVVRGPGPNQQKLVKTKQKRVSGSRLEGEAKAFRRGPTKKTKCKPKSFYDRNVPARNLAGLFYLARSKG